MRLFFFYDTNFVPLRDHMVSTIQQSGNCELVIEEDFVQDLGVMAGRAGGGLPTYLYKATKVLKALDEVAAGEVFIFSDVDIQFFRPVDGLVNECMASGVDLILQREFEDIGVNIGFMAMRSTQACRAFWAAVREEVVKSQGLDQRIVNNMLYSGEAAELGLRWDRFPPRVWCSAMGYPSGVLPEGVVIHHANFTIERSTSSDPSIKLEQMRLVRAAVLVQMRDEGVEASPDDVEALAELQSFLAAVAVDCTMADYRDRHFGARRPGREWSTLPEDHLARRGGFKEKRAKKKKQDVAAAEAAETSAVAAAELPAVGNAAPDLLVHLAEHAPVEKVASAAAEMDPDTRAERGRDSAAGCPANHESTFSPTEGHTDTAEHNSISKVLV